jgi:flavin-dependent dehydrogenase
MTFTTPHGTVRYRLPWRWAAFDYRTLCETCSPSATRASRPRRSNGRTGFTVHTDRGDLHAPLIVDALGWRRVLARSGYQPPDAPLSRGLEVHPGGAQRRRLDVWVDRSLAPRGFAWRVPAGEEERIGVGSYEPRHHVREPTEDLAQRLGADVERWQGNWFPHRLRAAAEDGVFFCGDSAGHCFPLSGEGSARPFTSDRRRAARSAPCTRRADAASRRFERYAAFSASHAHAFRRALRLQRLIPGACRRVC